MICIICGKFHILVDISAFCGQFHILWTFPHFGDSSAFCGQFHILQTVPHFADSCTFCRQFHILRIVKHFDPRANQGGTEGDYLICYDVIQEDFEVMVGRRRRRLTELILWPRTKRVVVKNQKWCNWIKISKYRIDKFRAFYWFHVIFQSQLISSRIFQLCPEVLWWTVNTNCGNFMLIGEVTIPRVLNTPLTEKSMLLK